MKNFIDVIKEILRPLSQEDLLLFQKVINKRIEGLNGKDQELQENSRTSG